MSTQIEHVGKDRILHVGALSGEMINAAGLFGTAGETRWRQEIFIPRFKQKGLPYFNPQKDNWDPNVDAELEATNMARDRVIVLPVTNDTTGYASLAEGGWAALGSILRGQKVGLYIENREGSMEDPAVRSRVLALDIANRITQDYPLFTVAESIPDLADWSVFQMQEGMRLAGSKMRVNQEIILPDRSLLNKKVSIFGTSIADSAIRKVLVPSLNGEGVPYFDAYKPDWDGKRDIPIERDHKIEDAVIVNAITTETESLGSLAECGWMALESFLSGQKYGLLISEHPSDRKSDTNRARRLSREHAEKILADFPGLFYLAKGPEDLTEYVMSQVRKF